MGCGSESLCVDSIQPLMKSFKILVNLIVLCLSFLKCKLEIIITALLPPWVGVGIK
jgi:hypothetical protein